MINMHLTSRKKTAPNSFCDLIEPHYNRRAWATTPGRCAQETGRQSALGYKVSRARACVRVCVSARARTYHPPTPENPQCQQEDLGADLTPLHGRPGTNVAPQHLLGRWLGRVSHSGHLRAYDNMQKAPGDLLPLDARRTNHRQPAKPLPAPTRPGTHLPRPSAKVAQRQRLPLWKLKHPFYNNKGTTDNCH